MSRFFALAAVGVSCMVAAHWGAADTVTMKNGTAIDGKIIRNSGGRITVQLGDREVNVPLDDVESTEVNDKRAPVLDIAAVEREARARDAELTEKTGLNAGQREAVDELLKIFFLGSPESAQGAKRSIMSMAATASPYRYLRIRLPEIQPDKVGPLLEVMCQMDPDGMRDILKEYATSPSEAARAAALESLARLKDRDALELMRRGTADEHPAVRIAAIHGIAALGARGATPVLLKLLAGGDPRVQNAARDALSALWTEPGQPAVNFLQNAGWQDFWNQKAATVPDAWDPDHIEPLVPPGTAMQID